MTWKTLQALNSDHLPIKISLNTKTKYRLIQHKHTYINYKKADWTKFTEQIENRLTHEIPPTEVHTSSKTLTNLILTADKHFVPKGRINNRIKLLPLDIRNTIKTRNRMRAIDVHDIRLQRLNQEIDYDIQKHKADMWREHLDKNWDHRQNTHILWKTIAGLSNKRPPQPYNRTINFNNKPSITNKDIAESFTKQFVNSTIHKTNRRNRLTDRKIKRMKGDPITITNEHTIDAIRLTKNNNSTGPDKINIKHLKHLGPLAVNYLTKILNLALNNYIIPYMWKLAKIVQVPKPNKDHGEGSSYHPISLLSQIAKNSRKNNITKNNC
jgi:hypothetical protein